MKVERPVLRNNFFFQIIRDTPEGQLKMVDPEELGWSDTTNGPEGKIYLFMRHKLIGRIY
jgi:hypothetical protein